MVEATEAIGVHALKDPYPFRGIDTTILHRLHLDPDQLRYQHLSRGEGLTEIHGQVVWQLVGSGRQQGLDPIARAS